MTEQDAQSILAFSSEAETIKWLLTKVLTLEGRIISLEKENAAMAARMDLTEENAEIQAGILARLKAEKLQPTQQDRGEVLRALLAANGGKMLAKDARHKMGLKKATFSVLLKAMQDEIDKKPLHSNRSMIIISLK